MNNQQAYTKSRNFLLTQMKRCTNGVECKYNDIDGMHCAIGSLIPQNEYDPTFEGNDITVIQSEVPTLKDLDPELLELLQRVHDGFEPDQWEYELDAVARKLNLEVEV